MKIFVRVKADARNEKIEQIDDTHFLIWTKEPAKENKANFKVVELLAKFFSVSPSQVLLLKGRRFKEKVFEIK